MKLLNLPKNLEIVICGSLQLELNLWDQIRQAEAAPTAIAFEQLLLSFDQELNRMSSKDKLEQWAEAIWGGSDFEEWQHRCVRARNCRFHNEGAFSPQSAPG